MHPESFCSFIFKDFISFKHLLSCQSILCLLRLSYYFISRSCRARIIAQAYQARDPYMPLKKTYVANIVKIYNSLKLLCLNKIFSRCVIGAEHYLFSSEPNPFCHFKLCIRAAINSKSFLPQHFQNVWVWRCFYGKELPESLKISKCFQEISCILSYSFLIIDMEWRRIFFYYINYFLFSKR